MRNLPSDSVLTRHTALSTSAPFQRSFIRRPILTASEGPSMVGGFCLVFHLLLSMHFFPSSKAHRRDLGSSAWPTYLPEDLGDENQGWRAHGYEPWPEDHPQQLQQHVVPLLRFIGNSGPPRSSSGVGSHTLNFRSFADGFVQSFLPET